MVWSLDLSPNTCHRNILIIAEGHAWGRVGVGWVVWGVGESDQNGESDPNGESDQNGDETKDR